MNSGCVMLNGLWIFLHQVTLHCPPDRCTKADMHRSTPHLLIFIQPEYPSVTILGSFDCIKQNMRGIHRGKRVRRGQAATGDSFTNGSHQQRHI